MKLMIVDDQTGSRDVIRKLFTSPDVAISECACLEQAVRGAREFKPDWIILDVKTPRIESLAATAVLRVEHPAVRIVMVNDNAQPFLAGRAEEPAAVTFVRREDLHQLLALLASTRGGRRSNQTL